MITSLSKERVDEFAQRVIYKERQPLEHLGDLLEGEGGLLLGFLYTQDDYTPGLIPHSIVPLAVSRYFNLTIEQTVKVLRIVALRRHPMSIVEEYLLKVHIETVTRVPTFLSVEEILKEIPIEYWALREEECYATLAK